MSQENVELVRQALATWAEFDQGRAGRESLDQFFAPDAIWDLGTFTGWPDQAVFRGLDGFLEWRNAWTEAYDDWGYAVEEIVDGGESEVVATFRQRGKPRGSDSWVEMRYGIVYTVKQGVIQRSRAYADADEALEAARRSK
jgi:ketosteroid isomerase-like protein